MTTTAEPDNLAQDLDAFWRLAERVGALDVCVHMDK